MGNKGVNPSSLLSLNSTASPLVAASSGVRVVNDNSSGIVVRGGMCVKLRTCTVIHWGGAYRRDWRQ